MLMLVESEQANLIHLTFGRNTQYTLYRKMITCSASFNAFFAEASKCYLHGEPEWCVQLGSRE